MRPRARDVNRIAEMSETDREREPHTFNRDVGEKGRDSFVAGGSKMRRSVETVEMESEVQTLSTKVVVLVVSFREVRT